MPVLVINNKTANPSAISDPETAFSEALPPNFISTFTVSMRTLDGLRAQLDDLATRLDVNGAYEFTVDVQTDETDAGAEYDAVLGLLRWSGNHINVGMIAANPTTPSTVSARRVNVPAGEIICDAKQFTYAGATDFVGDAEIDADGVDVSGVALTVAQDVYMHVLAVNNAGTLEIIFVRGTGVSNVGSLVAVPLTTAQLADAVGVYLATGGAYANFVNLATVLFEETAGLAQTTTPVPPVPGAYA